MSLRDSACYTLQIQPSASNPGIIELVEVEGSRKENRYARVKEKNQGEIYTGAIYDYLSGAKLASVGYLPDKKKARRLQLHGPDEDIPFEFTGKINFEWTFQFQGNKFRWSRELYGKDYICSIDRKPDPKVEICLARGPEKNEPGRIQILHYNIDRFPNEITDIRGLETLLVTTLMSFIDASDERTSKPLPALTSATATLQPPLPKRDSGSASSSTSGSALGRVVSEEDYEPDDPNEITVSMKSNMDDHIARACGLLMDPQCLYIVIRTRQPEAAQRALEVALGVTRFRRKENLGDLHQYVIEAEKEKPPAPPKEEKKGPKIINLDDPRPQPPKPTMQKEKEDKKRTTSLNIAIYLSTIELPDLHPSRRSSQKSSTNPITPGSSNVKTAINGASVDPKDPAKFNKLAKTPSPTSAPPSTGDPSTIRPSGSGFLAKLAGVKDSLALASPNPPPATVKPNPKLPTPSPPASQSHPSSSNTNASMKTPAPAIQQAQTPQQQGGIDANGKPFNAIAKLIAISKR